MGIDVTAHLGPYLEYTVGVEETEFSSCPEPSSCPNPTEGYCQRCGKKASQLSYTSDVEVPEIDLMDMFGEALFSPSSPNTVAGKRTYVALPNEKREGTYTRDDNWDTRRCEETAVDIQPDQIRSETEWFEQAFAPEIAELRARCGRENVRVCWGLVIFSW